MFDSSNIISRSVKSKRVVSDSFKPAKPVKSVTTFKDGNQIKAFPHQSTKECMRRVRQTIEGKLSFK